MLNNGQTFPYAFFMASVIFFILLLMVFSYWTYAMKETAETKRRGDAFNYLLAASQVWLKEGYPKYWGESSVLEIGFTNDRKINSTKLQILNSSIGYQKFLSLLNIGPYNVFYNVTDENSQTIFSFGLQPSQAKNVYQIERVGVLNNRAVKIKTIIWD